MFRFEPMDEGTYEAWRVASQRNYASEKVKAGNWKPEEAEALSREAFDKLLPDGRETAGQEVRSMVNDAGEKVGHAWFTIENREMIFRSYY